MYKFTVEYYYRRYHTGNLDKTVTRTATVYAESLNEATKMIVKADNDFKCVANVSFEEMTEVETKQRKEDEGKCQK